MMGVRAAVVLILLAALAGCFTPTIRPLSARVKNISTSVIADGTYLQIEFTIENTGALEIDEFAVTFSVVFLDNSEATGVGIGFDVRAGEEKKAYAYINVENKPIKVVKEVKVREVKLVNYAYNATVIL